MSNNDTQESVASSVDAKAEDIAAKEEDFEEKEVATKEEDVAAKEEDEEDFEEQQRMLPQWIRNKTYSTESKEADKELWEDIRKEDEDTGGSFLEEKFLKYILIDAETRRAYVQMPSMFHQAVVRKVTEHVRDKSTPSHPVLATASGNIELKSGSEKEPDIYIFGEDRTQYDEFGSLECKCHQVPDEERDAEEMNPHAIIEVSWTNKIEDELEKFGLEMNDFDDELGTINVGYLIQFIPLMKHQFPMKRKRGQQRPLVGIDVYRMEAGGDKLEPGDTFVRWRFGEDYPDLEITAEDLGQGTGGEGVSISLANIVGALTNYDIVFQEPDKGKDAPISLEEIDEEQSEEDVNAKEEDFEATIWEEEQKQMLPEWIRNRTYSKNPEEADEQLWKDIREEDNRTGGSFLEEKFLKYILIDAETRRAYVKIPTYFHEAVVDVLTAFVTSKSTPSHPVLATACGNIELKTGSKKNPDIYIFGQDRTKNYHGVLLWRTCRFHEEKSKKRCRLATNPHAIIEVSWTNKIKDELEKFSLEMTECKSNELGAIKVGYLITFIPLRNNQLPTEENPDHPLVRIDVYRMKPGDKELDPGDTFLSWRCGENYPDLEITAEDLGQGTGGEGVSIPFKLIVGALTDYDIVFQKPEEGKDASISLEEIDEEQSGEDVNAKEEDFEATIWEEEQKQMLPEWIRNKTYSKVPEEADKELWEDIQEEDERTGGSFLEEKFLKYILIDAETRKAYVKMPSMFHQCVVQFLTSFVNSKSTTSHPVLATASGNIELTTGSEKNPDIYIFGENRTKCHKSGTRHCKRHQFADKEKYSEEMNPHAIIEISWTNKIEDELEKFFLQMNNFDDVLGSIKVGYLITFIPLKNNQLPTKKNRDRPLKGIDVYRMEAGDDQLHPDDTLVKWRCGENYPPDLEITAENLEQGTGGEGVSISFTDIVEQLTDVDIVFQKPDEIQEGGNNNSKTNKRK